MTTAPGTRLGPYEIVAPIGAGGMGEVFRAKDTRLDRFVAIKVLPASMSNNPALRQRFEREAQIISSLSHPNICALHDIGQENTTDYLVMELLEGESLEHRLSKGALPIDQALRYGIEIASALDKAHRQGITHRDLKPGNIMLTPSGAKLLDFGLAKYRQQIEGAPLDGITGILTEQKQNLTAEGTILGTFQYMAPEQLEGLEADARTDIFAFGALLYEMVTGRRAFEGKTRTSLIAAIVDRDPAPISSIKPLSPPALERVITICLAKNPEERWQTAHDILLQLKGIQESGSQAGAHPLVKRGGARSTRVAWIIAMVASALAIALLVNQRLSRDQPPRPYYSAIAPPAGSEFWLAGPDAGAMTISPDSRYLTFVAPDTTGLGRIWVRDLHTSESRALAGTEGGQYPFWSPDGRQIGFFHNRKLKTIPVEGGSSVDICDVREPRGGSWSSQGVIVFTPHWRDPLYKVPATGGEPVAVTKINASRNETTHRWPVFLPDGKHFLFFAGSHTSEATSGNNAVYLTTVDGGTPKLLLRARSNVVYAGGHLIFLREQQLLAQRFDVDSLELKGDPVQLAEGVRYERGFFQAVFAASDELLAYQGGGSETTSQINWIDRKGEKLGTVGTPAVFFDVSIDPSGKVAAVGIGDPADLWLVDLERGVSSRFTFDSWQESGPVWSPDSKTVLYWTDRNVNVDTMRKSLGAAEELFLGDPAMHEKPLDWSRDGRFIALAKERLEGSDKDDLWIHPTDPNQKPFPYIATRFNEWDARFSPDGKQIAYVSNESGRDEVYVAAFPQAVEKMLISSGGGSLPRWRKDGRELFYVAPNGAIMSVPVTSLTPFTPGAPVALFRVPMVATPFTRPYDATADGQRFLIDQPQQTVEEPVTLVMNWTAKLKQERR